MPDRYRAGRRGGVARARPPRRRAASRRTSRRRTRGDPVKPPAGPWPKPRARIPPGRAAGGVTKGRAGHMSGRTYVAHQHAYRVAVDARHRPERGSVKGPGHRNPDGRPR
ncbi:hypothetical protein GCM10010324_64840 [Streptomyces hiroshimensis]|uniref:Uncharacterized protein n=1 Tax=Streptomyces hiroshimensis TaxID=66424 RepID=A0ABQ2ZC36_9ACTN|nr:hypothetical protein GCM10010324_64840 [Streptomyces hiroshimensis]